MPKSDIPVLLVDDDEDSLELMRAALAQPGIALHAETDPEQALDWVAQHHPPIVFSDLVMPGLDGIELLERIMEIDPATEVILMTAHYTIESAVEAIKKGASDYLSKPVSIDALRKKLNEVVAQVRQRERALALEDALAEESSFAGMIGHSPRMTELFQRVRRIAPHYQSALVLGPTGTGKELIARALHDLSPAAKKNFVAVNCSAMVETLFESELFGHVRGSFTGATQDKPGLMEVADGGTLFLDEIGDMPLSIQAKLLRVLQSREVQRVGSLSSRKVSLRVVAATHRNLRAAVAEGKFREDLFYRLSLMELHVPRLADRTGDLPLLVRHFVQHFAEQYGKNIRGVTARAMMLLERHTWPGNVRELENAIGHAAILVMGEVIDTADLPEYLIDSRQISTHTLAIDEGLEAVEKRLLEDALAQAKGNKSAAARALRISRDTLRYRLKKHNLEM
ncbi:MAG: sigma-54 dependent transcriptional regulator [Bryobacter sp.]|nr:sigma-54 dependent transcriptional regulator [Bryobacter sp.]